MKPNFLVMEKIENNQESKCSMKIETNSKGYNTTVHVYEGCTEQQILDTIKQTILAHKGLQEQISKLPERGS